MFDDTQPTFTIETAGVTDVGHVRTANEDHFVMLDHTGSHVMAAAALVGSRRVEVKLSSLTFRTHTFLPRAVDHSSGDPRLPRHSQEQTAVVEGVDRHVPRRRPRPRQIENVHVFVSLQRPALPFLQDRLAIRPEQIVRR